MKKGRTLAITVKDLLESKRLEVAVHLFKEDPSLLGAILIELGMESQNVAKYSIIREAMRHNGLDRFELRPMLSRFNDFCTYNIYWGMDEVTKGYYIKDPKLEKTTNDSGAILKEVKSKLNNSENKKGE